MSTYTQIYYHIVFSTKNRKPVLTRKRREDLFRYIWGITKNKNCYLYQINATADHLHMLTSIHPTIALADLVKDIKTASTRWIQENSVFPNFATWQEGYGAFTLSINEKDEIITYIKEQEAHHQKITFQEEFKSMLEKAGFEFEESLLA